MRIGTNREYLGYGPNKRSLYTSYSRDESSQIGSHTLQLSPKASILVNSDNSTVVAYINKQGGTRSVSLMKETYLLFDFLQSHQLLLRASYLPGAKNVIADSLSRRNQVLPSEWTLHPQIVHRIFSHWETPQIDLFATKRNTKLPLYVSPVPDQDAWAEDALSISWKGLIAYAYPPPSIMNKVMEKILQEECRVILIASAWPTQPWYTLLLDLSVDHPLRLPITQDLLKQTDKPFFHSNPAHLKLHAWKLQGGNSRNRDSPAKSLLDSWNLKDLPPEESMAHDGQTFVLGVNLNRKILSKPLPL